MDQDEVLARLYESLVAKRNTGATTVRDLPENQRRAYMREKKAESRAKQRASAKSGHPEPTAAAIRDALADAAIMILATGSSGADQVMHALGRSFPGRPGLPMSVEQKARSGRLKPKLNLNLQAR